MEDECEVLDWGHEDELAVVGHGADRRTFDVDDAEDAVSLGGDEDDEFLLHRPQKSARQQRQDPPSPPTDSPSPPHPQDVPADPAPLPPRAHAFGPLVHALPPKPVLSTVPFVHPSHPSTIEATAMASRVDRDHRNGTGSKPAAYDYSDQLPPGWELKYPRNGRGVYYYNIHTQESTWTRPSRETRGDWSDRRDDPLDKPLSTRNGESLVPRVGRQESGDMSYNDRHYRPGESVRRDDRPARSSQRRDSYIPDAHSPNHRNSRTSPPSPRARDRDPSPPSRRPPSATGSYGDRDAVQSSYREAVSTQDRDQVPRDNAPDERPRERRQRDASPPPETDRRIHSERSSTTRPRSPASYPRGSQGSANTAPQASDRQFVPAPEAPPAGRRSRFSQADAPAQPSHRQPESREVGMRRARTDDVSYSARYVDDIPSSRSNVRGDDVTPTHPASDAQRSGSRKRTPLPPQDEAFHPARPVPAPRGAGAGLAPASTPENRQSNRIDDSARQSLSPVPQPRPPPAERSVPDRGRPRWSKPHTSGPSRVDSRATHESTRGRAHDVVPMDVDDPPLPRSSDTPVKQIPLKRPALQDEVPRYPRAMLNPDNDGPRGVRESRDRTEPKHRGVVDGPSRFGPQRDRMGTERPSTDQASSQQQQQQKEPSRGEETPGSNIKLSGTNNTPIGSRNKFAGNVPPPAVPPPPSTSRRVPVLVSGSNGEPVVSRRERANKDHERPPHFDGPPMEPTMREDVRQSPLNNARALPLAEPAPPPTRPSRAALGISRFGPPIAKEKPEPVRPQPTVSSESQGSEPIPESSSRATPPPPSRESSMTSFKEAAPPARPSHLPPRPASPPLGFRFPPGDANRPQPRPSAQVPVPRDRDGAVEVPAPPKPPSPPPRKYLKQTYPPAPPAPQEKRSTYIPERLRKNIRDTEAAHPVARPPPLPPVVQVEDSDRAPPPMHPERALMLQANGLPARPLTPGGLGRGRPARGGFKRGRDDRDQERIVSFQGNSRPPLESVSPIGERRRYPEDDRPVYSSGGGASLLDRLTLDDGLRTNSPSLRDRVQLPSKRDREEMLVSDLSFDMEAGDEYDGTKRMRRRGGPKIRKGRG